jgi:APA family basic amino acid/polyamine antiporter
MPTNSSILGLLLCAFWMAQWELGLIQGKLPGIIAWENDELPIITLYAAYIPIFIVMMIKFKELNAFKRFVLPAVAIVASLFMVYAAISAYKIQALYYIIVFVVVMAIGMLFYRKNAKPTEEKTEE